MKKKLNLSELKVDSFVTSGEKLKGGTNTGQSFTCPPPVSDGCGDTIPGWWTDPGACGRTDETLYNSCNICVIQ